MIVYSVEYRHGRRGVGGNVHRKWFATYQKAETWIDAAHVKSTTRDQIGPNKHVIEGKAGLLSFLQTYKGRE